MLNEIRYSDKITLNQVIKYHEEVFGTPELIGTHNWQDETFESGIDTAPKRLLYEALINYWEYCEIGFDSTDLFIKRLNTYWNEYAPHYIPYVIRALQDKFPFYYEIEETSSYSNEYTPLAKRTEETTYDSQYTSTRSGSDTDSLRERASQNATNTRTYNSGTITPHSGKDTVVASYDGASDTTERTEGRKKTIVDNSVYAMMDYMNSQPYIRSFIDRFYNLFMEIF